MKYNKGATIQSLERGGRDYDVIQAKEIGLKISRNVFFK